MERIDIGQSVETLDFGSKHDIRIQHICHRFDIKTIQDLCKWPGKELIRVRNMGRKSIEEIENVLKRYNLHLGMTDKELDEYAGTENPVQEEEEEEKKWEQRRYEIAREMFVQHRILAVAAVKEADDLIAVLRHGQHA